MFGCMALGALASVSAAMAFYGCIFDSEFRRDRNFLPAYLTAVTNVGAGVGFFVWVLLFS
jgi:hypothetical protein